MTTATTPVAHDFKRDPLTLIAAVQAVLQACTLFFHFSTDAEGAVTALIAVLAGAAAALTVSYDRFLPFWTEIGKAVFVVTAAWGWDVPANVQAGVMAILAVLSGAYLRTQLSPKTAPAPVPVATQGAGAIPRQTGSNL